MSVFFMHTQIQTDQILFNAQYFSRLIYSLNNICPKKQPALYWLFFIGGDGCGWIFPTLRRVYFRVVSLDGAAAERLLRSATIRS